MKARKFLIVCLIFILIFLTLIGSDSINSIDNLAYIVSIGFDISENKKLKISFQIAVPSGNSSSSSSDSSSSQSSSSIVNTVECNTLESGIDILNSYLSKKVNLSHCKAIVFSEEISYMGIGQHLYTIMNNLEIRPTCNIIISRCNASYFIENSKPMLERLSSKYYEVASTSHRNTGYTANITLQDFYSNLTDSSSESYAILGSVNSKDSQESNDKSLEEPDNSYIASELPVNNSKNIETLGLAVFKGDKLVGELNGLESISHLILTNNLENAIITIPSPFESTNYIDLYLVKSKCKIKSYISNGTPYIKPSIMIEARIISLSDDYKYLDKKNIKAIEQYATSYIKAYVHEYLYKTSKEFKSDIAGFGKYFISNFLTWDDWNKYNWLDNYQNSIFSADVKVKMRSRFLLIDT